HAPRQLARRALRERPVIGIVVACRRLGDPVPRLLNHAVADGDRARPHPHPAQELAVRRGRTEPWHLGMGVAREVTGVRRIARGGRGRWLWRNERARDRRGRARTGSSGRRRDAWSWG